MLLEAWAAVPFNWKDTKPIRDAAPPKTGEILCHHHGPVQKIGHEFAKLKPTAAALGGNRMTPMKEAVFTLSLSWIG